MLYNKLIPVKKYLIGIKVKGIEKAQRNIVSKIDLNAIIE